MPTITPLIAGGLSLATSAVGAYNGYQQKKDAQNALDNLEVPENRNPFEDSRISTLGSDLIREEGQRTTANVIDLVQGSGVRGVMSAVPKLMAINNDSSQRASAELDRQVLNREKNIANYEMERNRVEETRYQNAVDGYGQMINQGNQQMWNGIKGGISSIGYMGRNMKGSDTEDVFTKQNNWGVKEEFY